MVTVSKKDGGVRITSDLSPLNKYIIPDRHPLPRIEELFKNSSKTPLPATSSLLYLIYRHLQLSQSMQATLDSAHSSLKYTMDARYRCSSPHTLWLTGSETSPAAFGPSNTGKNSYLVIISHCAQITEPWDLCCTNTLLWGNQQSLRDDSSDYHDSTVR